MEGARTLGGFWLAAEDGRVWRRKAEVARARAGSRSERKKLFRLEFGANSFSHGFGSEARGQLEELVDGFPDVLGFSHVLI